MGMATRAIILVYAMLALALSSARASPPRAGDKWRKPVDWAAVERQLEEGDDPELLKSEDSVLISEMARRKAAPARPPAVDAAERADRELHAEAMSGPTMIFAQLTEAQASGAAWDEESLAELSLEWRELLFTTGIKSTVYDLHDRRLLVALQEGWRGYEVLDFLQAQATVLEVQWDSAKYPGGAAPTPGRGPRRKAARGGGKKRGSSKNRAREGAAAAGLADAPTAAAASRVVDIDADGRVVERE